MLLSLLPVTALAEDVTYGVTIEQGGIGGRDYQIRSDTAYDVLGDSTVSFVVGETDSSGTLTLNNAKLATGDGLKGVKGIYSTLSELTIELVGDNVIGRETDKALTGPSSTQYAAMYGIYSLGAVKLVGDKDASLTIVDREMGIVAESIDLSDFKGTLMVYDYGYLAPKCALNATGGDVVIKGGTFHLESALSNGIKAEQGSVYISDANVYVAAGDTGIRAQRSVYLTGADVEVTATAITMDGSTDAHGIYGVEGNVTISGSKVTVNVNVKAGNNGICAGGLVKLDGGTVTVESTGGCGLQSAGNVVIAKGDVTVTSTAAINGSGIYSSQGNITIEGGNVTVTGKLNGICASFYDITITGNTLNIEDGVVLKGSRFNGNGGMINVAADATLNMNGGTIKKCEATSGGAVNVASKGTFNMSGGTIEDCTAVSKEYDNANSKLGRGGAVYVAGKGTFNLSDGTIERCKATVAGGAAYSWGTVKMTDGTISECSVSGLPDASGTEKAKGGAMYLFDGTFEMLGGEITGNTLGQCADMRGAGVYAATGVGATLGKNAQIIGNKAGEAEAASNLYLCDAESVTLGTEGNKPDGMTVGTVTAEAVCGVERDTAVYTVEGDAVVVTVTPDTGYALASLTYTVGSDTYVIDADAEVSFYMVADDVTVTAVFEALTYTVTLNANGGGGGGIAPSTTVSVTGDKSSVKVAVTVNDNVASVRTLTGAELSDIGTGKTVAVDLSTVTQSVTGASFTKETFKNIASSEAAGLTVKPPGGKVAVFDKSTVEAVAEQAAGANIKLVIETATVAEQELNAAQRKTVKELNGALVIDAYFVSNGKRVSDFKGGTAELTIEYPTTKPVRVWYIAEDGSKEAVASSFDGKSAKFVVTHFSHYAIEQLEGSGYAACPRGTVCPIAAFTDSSTTEWYHDGVHYCVENGMMNGVSATEFAPSATLTRGMVVTVLARLDGVTITSTGENWFADGQQWAVRNGISDGTGMTDAITREQLATMLYRYAEYKKIDTDKFTENTNTLSYGDVFEISDWATNGTHFCLAAGVVGGYEDGTIRPQGQATRAEAAAMFQRFCEKVIK